MNSLTQTSTPLRKKQEKNAVGQNIHHAIVELLEETGKYDSGRPEENSIIRNRYQDERNN